MLGEWKLDSLILLIPTDGVAVPAGELRNEFVLPRPMPEHSISFLFCLKRWYVLLGDWAFADDRFSQTKPVLYVSQHRFQSATPLSSFLHRVLALIVRNVPPLLVHQKLSIYKNDPRSACNGRGNSRQFVREKQKCKVKMLYSLILRTALRHVFGEIILKFLPYPIYQSLQISDHISSWSCPPTK